MEEETGDVLFGLQKSSTWLIDTAVVRGDVNELPQFVSYFCQHQSSEMPRCFRCNSNAEGKNETAHLLKLLCEQGVSLVINNGSIEKLQ